MDLWYLVLRILNKASLFCKPESTIINYLLWSEGKIRVHRLLVYQVLEKKQFPFCLGKPVMDVFSSSVTLSVLTYSPLCMQVYCFLETEIRKAKFFAGKRGVTSECKNETITDTTLKLICFCPSLIRQRENQTQTASYNWEKLLDKHLVPMTVSSPCRWVLVAWPDLWTLMQKVPM